MADEKGTNKTYRDRLFKFIFGNPQNKEWTLSLYNAVNGSSYTNPDDIKLTTIEDAVYMNMKNDVSFLIADNMNFLYMQEWSTENTSKRTEAITDTAQSSRKRLLPDVSVFITVYLSRRIRSY